MGDSVLDFHLVKPEPCFCVDRRWCVSCFWSTATVVLHRLMTSPLRPLAAIKPSPKPPAKSRAAGTDHLHPEPLVECVVLHQPPSPTLDVIFVHGLYGSLGNTWRQGDWRSKYKLDPTKVPLRNHNKVKCNCDQNTEQTNKRNENEVSLNFETELDETEATVHNINEQLLKKIIPNDNSLITEQFYNNTLLDRVEIIDNYETQAKFVQDLFKNKNNCDINGCDIDNLKKSKEINEYTHKDCKCRNKICNVGCGCVCDQCYSLCWPKDWIKADFPGARVISINYTSDPYLWRPLWRKEFKRLRLHERAEQMIQQLLELGVGEKPIIWVGHSKGGLFIKQIYCEAYDAHKIINRDVKTQDRNIDLSNTDSDQNCSECNTDNKINHLNDISNRNNKKDMNASDMADFGKDSRQKEVAEVEKGSFSFDCNDGNNINDIAKTYGNTVKDSININNSDLETSNCSTAKEIAKSNEVCVSSEQSSNNSRCTHIDMFNSQPVNVFNGINTLEDVFISNKGNIDFEDIKINVQDDKLPYDKLEGDDILNNDEASSITEEEKNKLKIRAGLWSNSAGFMFYSVPHRGSPLADIKTPITARSIELLEISKDCSLVLDLQKRWLVATSSPQPVVRSLVETCRTLMSVLWLRIVSVDSADAGIGSLCGVSVDHREICKPSSRNCLLYTELTDVIRDALSRHQCH